MHLFKKSAGPKQSRALRKLYARAFDIARFDSEKRTPFSGIDIESTTDPTADVQRDLVSIWFNPDVDSPKGKVPHEDEYLVFRGHHDIDVAGNFLGRPHIDVHRPGGWEHIFDHIWERVVNDEADLRKANPSAAP